jgi:hypothetical protein
MPVISAWACGCGMELVGELEMVKKAALPPQQAHPKV